MASARRRADRRDSRDRRRDFQAEADPFHPVDNPEGYVNLGTAENRLVGPAGAPAHRRARPTRRTRHYGLPTAPAGLRDAPSPTARPDWRTAATADDLVVPRERPRPWTSRPPSRAIRRLHRGAAPYYSAFDTAT